MDSVDGQDSDQWFNPPLSPLDRNYVDRGNDFVLRGVKHDQLFNYPEQAIDFEFNPMFDEMCMEYIRTGERSPMLGGSLHEVDCRKQYTSQAASLSPSSHTDQGNDVVLRDFKHDQQQLQPMSNPTIVVTDHHNGFTDHYSNADSLLQHPEQSNDFESSHCSNEVSMSCFTVSQELEGFLCDAVCREERVWEIEDYLKGDAPTPKPEEEDWSQTLEDLLDFCNIRPTGGSEALPFTAFPSHPVTPHFTNYSNGDSSMQNEPSNEKMIDNHLSAPYYSTANTNTSANYQMEQHGLTEPIVTDDFQVVKPSNDDAAQNQVSTNASFAGSAVDPAQLGEATNKQSIAAYTNEKKKSNKKIQRNSHKAAQNCNKILPTAQLEKDGNTTKKRGRGRVPIGNKPKKSSQVTARYRSTTKHTGESADLFIKKCFDCSLGFEEQQFMMLCKTYKVAVTKLAKKYGWDMEVLLKKVQFHEATYETLHPRYGPGREAADPDKSQMRTIQSGPRVPLLLLYDQLLQLQKKQVPDYNIVMEDLKTNRPKLYKDLTTTRRRLISRELSNPPHQGPLIPTAEPNQAATKSRKRTGDNSVGSTSRDKKGKFV